MVKFSQTITIVYRYSTDLCTASGTFQSAATGTFVSDTGGTFIPILSDEGELNCCGRHFGQNRAYGTKI